MLGDTCDTIRGGNCPIFPNNGPGVGLCNGLCVVPIDPDECVYRDLDSRLPDATMLKLGNCASQTNTIMAAERKVGISITVD